MSIPFLITINIILSVLLITGIIFFCEYISQFISHKSKVIRKIITENEGLFTILFVLVFLIEQIAFILILTVFFKVSKWISAIVGIFALIVVTTATLQKFIWEYKFQWSEGMRRSAENAQSVINEQKDFINYLLDRLSKKSSKSKKEKSF